LRTKLNLDLRDLSKFCTLIHGNYNTGKTHLLGDALKHESQYGQVLFLNAGGEDGYLSLANSGLGEVGETVTEYKDFLAICDEYREKKIRALGVDSMKALSQIVMASEVGDRLPTIGGQRNEWSEIHHKMTSLVNKLKAIAPVVVCVSPSDKSVDQITGKTFVTPDMPGRQAAGSAGWFDFVFYLVADVLGPGKVRRVVTCKPSSSVITRQRLPKPILDDLVIPDGSGGWAAIRAKMEAALGVEK